MYGVILQCHESFFGTATAQGVISRAGAYLAKCFADSRVLDEDENGCRHTAPWMGGNSEIIPRFRSARVGQKLSGFTRVAAEARAITRRSFKIRAKPIAVRRGFIVCAASDFGEERRAPRAIDMLVESQVLGTDSEVPC